GPLELRAVLFVRLQQDLLRGQLNAHKLQAAVPGDCRAHTWHSASAQQLMLTTPPLTLVTPPRCWLSAAPVVMLTAPVLVTSMPEIVVTGAARLALIDPATVTSVPVIEMMPAWFM